jgi:hypothetical protein
MTTGKTDLEHLPQRTAPPEDKAMSDEDSDFTTMGDPEFLAFSEQSMGALRFGCCRRPGRPYERRRPNATDVTSGNEEEAGDPFDAGCPLSVVSRCWSLQPWPAEYDIPVSTVARSSGHSVL